MTIADLLIPTGQQMLTMVRGLLDKAEAQRGPLFASVMSQIQRALGARPTVFCGIAAGGASGQAHRPRPWVSADVAGGTGERSLASAGACREEQMMSVAQTSGGPGGDLSAALKPVGEAPALKRINGFGMGLYGSLYDEEAFGELELSMYWICFLWLPIVPLGLYLVTREGERVTFHRQLATADFHRLFKGRIAAFYRSVLFDAALEFGVRLVVFGAGALALYGLWRVLG